MNRRHFLGAVGSGMVGSGIAGCLRGSGRTRDLGTPGNSRSLPPDRTPGTGHAETTALVDPELPVEDAALVRGGPKDGIPAITDPSFGTDWTRTSWSLDEDDRVIGVTERGTSRAYPLTVLNWHEIVNDSFGGPLLLTYCPLCASAVVAERTVDGNPSMFGVSGYLWHSDLVLYDRRTGSLWSQILAKGIRGPETGTDLDLRPARLSTWAEWQTAHPSTEVLLPPVDSGTLRGEVYEDYDHNPHGIYEDGTGLQDGPLRARVPVIGVTAGGKARAYPHPAIREAGGIVNDSIGGRQIVVAMTPGESLVAYDRQVAGRTLTFDLVDDRLVAGGSRWSIVTGEALTGPFEGQPLSRASTRSDMYWFAWSDFYPDTTVYGESDPDE